MGVRKVFKLLLIATGLLLVLDSILITTVSNFNLGVIMPALLGIPLLILGLFYEPALLWFTYGSLGKLMKWVLIAGYSCFALSFIPAAFLIGKASNAQPVKNADCVIVLGAGLRGSRVSYTLARRLDAAIEYAGRYPETLILVTGARGPGEQISEAEAMAGYLLNKGIEKKRIIKEEQAASTNENFRYSKSILDKIYKKPYQTVFVTTDFHMFRAELTAKKEGLSAYGIGSKTKWYLLPNAYLREYIAIGQYLLTGKILLPCQDKVRS